MFGQNSRRLVLFPCLLVSAVFLAVINIGCQGGQDSEAAPSGSSTASEQAPPAKAPPPSATYVAGAAGRIVPVHLAWSGPGGGLQNEIAGCLPAGPGADVVWDRDKLFLLKKKGRLELVFTAAGVNDRFSTGEPGNTCVCYDGQYVWAALERHNQTPMLVILDPSNGKTWTVGPEDGLPVDPDSGRPTSSDSPYLLVGAIAPGRALLAYCTEGSSTPYKPGSRPVIRYGAARLIRAEFDPEKGAKFHVFLSPEQAPAGPQAPAANVRVERPVAILDLFAPAGPDEKAARRLAVTRNQSSFQLKPLLVDPDTLTYEFAANNATAQPINGSRYAVLDGALYWLTPSFRESSKPQLIRAALPKLEEQVLLEEMPDGKPIVYGDGLMIFGDKVWFWKPGGQNVEVIDVRTPWGHYHAFEPQDAPPTISGEHWRFESVYASQVYGALVRAIKMIGPNHTAGEYKLFQFGLADDPRVAPESPPRVERPRLAVSLPPGTAASELSIYAGGAEGAAPLAKFGNVVEAEVEDKLRYPILAREIVRQALLIAAREQLQWNTRDAVLGEGLESEATPAAKFVVSTRFPYAGAGEFELRRIDAEADAASVWKEQLVLNEKDDEPLDYGRLVEAAERWSREAFPALLKQNQLTGEPVASSDEAALSPAADEWLRQMAFTAQFVVVRDLHRAIRRQGESDELLGALVRAYANLGVLSEFHWNSMHKALKARSLLYAQRYVARKPQSGEARWHRAYAKALTGLHDSAIADLEAAAKLRADAAAAAERPRWVEIIEAYCRFDTDKLAAFAAQEDYASLAALLQFFHVESLKESAAVQTLARRLVEKNPEDFRLLDAMCDSCALDTLHIVTQLAPAVLQQTAAARLGRLSALPSATTELLNRPDVSVSELAESLLTAPAADDEGEFSWRVLGRMLEETEFIQLWRRAYFVRFQWAVPADDFLAAIEGLASAHRFRPLIDLCSSDAARAQSAAEAISARLVLEELEYPQQRAFQQAMGKNWQTRWTEQYAQAEARPALHIDDVHRDLLRRLEYEQWRAGQNLTLRLNRISSDSPDAAAAMVRLNHGIEADALKAAEAKFARHAQFWKAIADYSRDADQRQQALRRYIDLSPDVWAYQRLAGQFRREGKIDQWKATLDECLQQPEFGLEHAALRVQMANFFMEQGQWEQARPYAEEAAESWAEWAMLCVIRCYQGLEDDENEGVWRERIAERYPKLQHMLDHYIWSRRTGRGDAKQLQQALDPQIAAAAPKTPARSQYRVGLFYQLSGQPQAALAAYQKDADDRRDARAASFDDLWAAAVAQQLGDGQARDAALRRVAGLEGAEVATYRDVAQWLQKCVAGKPGEPADVASARQIVAKASPSDRTGLSGIIGRFLDSIRQADEAVEFYRMAVAEPAGRFGASYAFICAVMRDRGLDPREGRPAAKPQP